MNHKLIFTIIIITILFVKSEGGDITKLCSNGVFKCVSAKSLRICFHGQLVTSEFFCPNSTYCSETADTICTIFQPTERPGEYPETHSTRKKSNSTSTETSIASSESTTPQYSTESSSKETTTSEGERSSSVSDNGRFSTEIAKETTSESSKYPETESTTEYPATQDSEISTAFSTESVSGSSGSTEINVTPTDPLSTVTVTTDKVTEYVSTTTEKVNTENNLPSTSQSAGERSTSVEGSSLSTGKYFSEEPTEDDPNSSESSGSSSGSDESTAYASTSSESGEISSSSEEATENLSISSESSTENILTSSKSTTKGSTPNESTEHISITDELTTENVLTSSDFTGMSLTSDGTTEDVSASGESTEEDESTANISTSNVSTEGESISSDSTEINPTSESTEEYLTLPTSTLSSTTNSLSDIHITTETTYTDSTEASITASDSTSSSTTEPSTETNSESNENLLTTISSSTLEPECAESGKFPVDKSNCTEYKLCILTSNGFRHQIVKCPIGTKFNPELQKCKMSYECLDNPLPTVVVTTDEVTRYSTSTTEDENTGTDLPSTTASSMCPTAGRFPVPNSGCTKFTSCVITENGMRHRVVECPKNTVFNPDIKKCQADYKCPELTPMDSTTMYYPTTAPVMDGSSATIETERPIGTTTSSESTVESSASNEPTETNISSENSTENDLQTSQQENSTTEESAKNNTTPTDKNITDESTHSGLRSSEVTEKSSTLDESTENIAASSESTENSSTSNKSTENVSISSESTEKNKSPENTSTSNETTEKLSTSDESIENNSLSSGSTEASPTSSESTEKDSTSSISTSSPTTTESTDTNITTESTETNITPSESTTTSTIEHSTTISTPTVEPECVESGKFPVGNTNCTEYRLCIETSTGFRHQIVECPTGTAFNPKLQRCQMYYECSDNSLSTTTEQVSSTTTEEVNTVTGLQATTTEKYLTNESTGDGIKSSESTEESITLDDSTESASRSTELIETGSTSNESTANVVTSSEPTEKSSTSDESTANVITSSESTEISSISGESTKKVQISSESTAKESTSTENILTSNQSTENETVSEEPIDTSSLPSVSTEISPTSSGDDLTSTPTSSSATYKSTDSDITATEATTEAGSSETNINATYSTSIPTTELSTGISTESNEFTENNLRSTTESSVCSRVGRFPAPNTGCTQYILCIKSSNGIKHQIVPCPENTAFNPVGKRCQTNYKCPENTSTDSTSISYTTITPITDGYTTSETEEDTTSSTAGNESSEKVSTSNESTETNFTPEHSTANGLTSQSSEESVGNISTSTEKYSTEESTNDGLKSSESTEKSSTLDESTENVLTTSGPTEKGSTLDESTENISTSSEATEKDSTSTEEVSISSESSEEESTSDELTENVSPWDESTERSSDSDESTANVSTSNESTEEKSTNTNNFTMFHTTTDEATQSDTFETSSAVPDSTTSSATYQPPTDSMKSSTIIVSIETASEATITDNANTSTTVSGLSTGDGSTTNSGSKAPTVNTTIITESLPPESNLSSTTLRTTPDKGSSSTTIQVITTSIITSSGTTTYTTTSSNVTTITNLPTPIVPKCEEVGKFAVLNSHCSQYALCVKTTQGFMSQVVSCPAGTYFDPKARRCRIDYVCDEDSPTTSQVSITTSDADKTTVTIGTTIIPECSKEGRFLIHNANCTKYMLCTKTHNGYVQNVYNCPKDTFFDSTAERCKLNYVCSEGTTKVPEITTPDSSSSEEIGTTEVPECIEEGRLPVGNVNCTKYTLCSMTHHGFEQNIYDCPKGTFFNPSSEKCELNYVCSESTTTVQEISTSVADSSEETGTTSIPECVEEERLPVYNVSCTKYTLCSKTSHGFVHGVYKCPEGTLFDPDSHRCRMNFVCPESTVLPIPKTKCVEQGKFPIENTNCSKYLHCLEIANGYLGRITDCPTETYFNPIDQKCSGSYYCPELDTTSAPSVDEACSSPGKFPIEDTNCTKYRNCAKTKTRLRYTDFDCPKGALFNPDIRKCDKSYVCPENVLDLPKPIKMERAIPECTIEGKFPVLGSNCDEYILCSRTLSGLVRRTYRCPSGTKYDIDKSRCSRVYECDEPYIVRNDSQCKIQGKFSVPGTNCTEFRLCSKTAKGYVSSKHSCPNGSLFSPTRSKCSTNHVCKEKTTKCTTIGMFPDPTDKKCKHYYECVENNNSVQGFRKKCRHGYHFDSETQKCTTDSRIICKPEETFDLKLDTISPSFLVNGRCTTVGRFMVDLTNCKNYTICFMNGGTLQGVQSTCPTITVFNQMSQKCESPFSYTCPDSVCRYSTPFQNWPNPNSEDCSSYISCEPVNSNAGIPIGNKGVVRYCPQFTRFNPALNFCDPDPTFVCQT